MNGAKIRVMVVEDHALLRLGLKIILEQRNIDVVAEAENGEQAIAVALEVKPDVILMDLSMPKMDGIEAARRIREFDSTVKIIMLTSIDNEEHIHASLAAGVNGYCLKETKPDRLVTALEAVREGDIWLDSSIAAKIVSLSVRQSDKSPAGQQISGNQLAPEQLSVLHLIIEGLGTSAIAAKLSKTEKAIKEIEFAIMERLASSERTQTALQKLRGGANQTIAAIMKTCQVCDRAFEAEFKCCPFDGARLEDIIADELTGTTFADKYDIIARVGSGGMSVVYKARHKLLGRTVAIKLLDPLLTSDLLNARRFREEALACSLLSHPNLITIYDFDLSPAGDPYLIMDFLSGKSLCDVINVEGPIDVERAVHIFIQACEGLEHAHSKGVIHRDLKPSNLMLQWDENSNRETVKVIDFGIAKVLSDVRGKQNLTLKGEILGSPTYMSPEQCMGLRLDVHSDIYSLGCSIYEALSADVPFQGKITIETMQMHIDRQPTSLLKRVPERNIPAPLDRIVMKTLRKNPSERYQSMAELRSDLVGVLESKFKYAAVNS